MSSAARFDEVVHAPIRLQICAMLSAVDSAGFATVRDGLEVADSVLSKHVRVLHEAGYVSVHKSTRASRVRTALSLTEAGRTAYEGHVAALQAIVGKGSRGEANGWAVLGSASTPGQNQSAAGGEGSSFTAGSAATQGAAVEEKSHGNR